MASTVLIDSFSSGFSNPSLCADLPSPYALALGITPSLIDGSWRPLVALAFPLHCSAAYSAPLHPLLLGHPRPFTVSCSGPPSAPSCLMPSLAAQNTAPPPHLVLQ
ncbi:hypothetical protein GOP47_0021248, partial [Adiantum capillus-veneris]